MDNNKKETYCSPLKKEIRETVNQLAEKINASECVPLYFDDYVDFGHPHIEIDHKGFHLVYVERGNEQKRKTTHDLNELYFWIFEGITFGMAVHYELDNRVERQDCRRLIFKKQLELLEQLNLSWKERVELKIQKVLTRSPFDDLGSIRATYCKQLRDKGHKSDRAWEIACAKYPLPY
jgi:hypothetical protein